MKLLTLFLFTIFLNSALADDTEVVRYISQSYSSEVNGVTYESKLQQELLDKAPDINLAESKLPVSFEKLELSAREKLKKAVKDTEGWLLYSITLSYLSYEKKYFYTLSFYKEGSPYSSRFNVLLTVDGKAGDIFEKTSRKI